MAVVREESFATVLPVMVVADEEEAIARANATEFGLSAAVFSGDRERAERVARRLHAAGQVHGCFYPKHIFLKEQGEGFAAQLRELSPAG